ncbi:MAG: M23 family metallopeptidase [Pseudomonadota bacterium]|nr:M23 family metallopeptidase [Pseudomonadota bacterium]
MLVPEGGRGEVWQASVPLRRVRLVLAVAATLLVVLVVLAGIQAATLPRVVAHDQLVGENLALKARLDQVDRRIADLAPLVERVRSYDDQLRAIEAREALPGFGPLDAGEVAERQAWIDGVIPGEGTGGAEQLPGEVEAHLAALEDDIRALTPGLGDYEELLARFDGLRSALPQLWPVDGVLTSPFGYRHSPFGRRWKMHTGLDLGAPYGSSIYATADGLVTFADWDSGHGRTVVVDHGYDVTTRYCHASRFTVAEGDLVVAGDVIALVGSTGMSTGPHLHYELLIDGEKVDPLEYLP